MGTFHNYFVSALLLSILFFADDTAGFKQVDYDSNVDYTHTNITRGALDEVAAIYIASVLRPNEFNLDVQNTSEILRLYFGQVKDARDRFELAVDEIVEGLGVAQSKVHQSPKLTMNNEMIAEGNSHLNTLRKQIVTLSSDGSPSWTIIRMLVGEYLYTLQDFYSNTNWIELGHGVLNSLDPNWPKGKGKCSHGGKSDHSHLLPASGGINKATMSPVLSPHFYLHSKAGSVATSATKEYFIRNETSLLTVMGYIRLGKLLGLDTDVHQTGCVNCNDPTVSIAFVIDTTGSMAADIFQVRKKAVEIVTKAMMPGYSPANYILTTFNDPASKTTYQVSTDGSKIKQWLNALVVDGGGDCPEYAMSGLIKAMEHANNGSCIFLFTDADPKDPELFGQVKTLMSTKNLHLVSFITGQCDGNLNATSGGGTGCISKSHNRRKKRGWGNFYQSLGGTYIPVKDRDISKPMDKLLEKNMAIKYVNNFTATISSDDLKIQVDSHITAFTLEIKGAPSSPKLALTRPDGSVETFTGKSSFNDIGRNTYIMSVVSPDAGVWILLKKDTTTWTVTVKEQGDIEFTHKFLENKHGGLLPVHGSPLAGTNLKVLVKVTGLNTADSLLFAVLLDDTRNIIGRFNLTESTQGRKRIGTVTFKIPSKPFRVAIQGEENGNIFQRESQEFMNPSSASIRILDNDGNIYVTKDTTISCEISNTGRTSETYQVTFIDSAGFVDASSSTVSTTVNAGASKIVSINVRGKVSPKTTTLSVQLISRGQEIQKQQIPLMVQLAVPPTLTVIHKSSLCSPKSLNYFNCSNQEISITSRIYSNSGLHSPYTRPSMEVDLHVNNSKYIVELRGDCCKPKFTLFVVDNATLHTEKTFDFTNGNVFSSVIPVKEQTLTTSNGNSSKYLIVYGIVGAVGACLVVAAVIVLAKYIYGKTPSRVAAEKYFGDKPIHNGPRMPRSHLRYFRK